MDRARHRQIESSAAIHREWRSMSSPERSLARGRVGFDRRRVHASGARIWCGAARRRGLRRAAENRMPWPVILLADARYAGLHRRDALRGTAHARRPTGGASRPFDLARGARDDPASSRGEHVVPGHQRPSAAAIPRRLSSVRRTGSDGARGLTYLGAGSRRTSHAAISSWVRRHRLARHVDGGVARSRGLRGRAGDHVGGGGRGGGRAFVARARVTLAGGDPDTLRTRWNGSTTTTCSTSGWSRASSIAKATRSCVSRSHHQRQLRMLERSLGTRLLRRGDAGWCSPRWARSCTATPTRSSRSGAS